MTGRTPFTSDTTPPPAGAYSVAMESGGPVTQSNFAGFDIEVDAILARR